MAAAGQVVQGEDVRLGAIQDDERTGGQRPQSGVRRPTADSAGEGGIDRDDD